ncbi:hypothetical protein TVAG_221190 [Trichomonas vaginalis G3]|uniref:Uncharacterized protein n=1 Tax=Trichomonas vaginalis (strain ATCC PRA-98 / G3) TaxID=412133 RepID=A2GLB6_TRIV3|nr:hypothetical protein TVAGG3_0143860 [Trichomonas vaginalis G3]EAX82052.1 hypothetical protein TVAG_221190 [Trichomonas vaginalis G3]KAI5546774.1 hypothetical protein TVAGG3_0143860 [Trichomonas vaginalis G3]|eukprot:XP_001294982.1 hypothetical protein [Trichomonas vaginalis G3]
MDERQVIRKLDTGQALEKLKKLITEGKESLESVLELDVSYQYLYRTASDFKQSDLVE